ncbi:MAG: transglycosylase domain-containing protein, partial [Longicatena sp.]
MEENKKNKKSKQNLVNKILIVMISMTLLVGVSGFFMLSTIIGKVSIANLTENFDNVEPSTFYSIDGKKIGELGGVSRENVTYQQIPQSTIDAFLAIEDSRYFAHNGFDLPRFISSALNNIRSGSFAQGGSTLTMQAIDNFMMKQEEEALQKQGKSFSKVEQIERKIKEIYLGMRLETELSKEEIITKYLNEINFGDRARGIQKGAQYYFGKNVEALNLSESAFLAGVINAPNSYNPYYGSKYYTLAIQRRNTTLSQMLNHGFISKTEYQLAKSTELSFQLSSGKSVDSDPYKAYIDKAAKEAIALSGKDPATTSMNIYTSLNIAAQDKANALSAGEGIDLPNNKYYQMGLTTLDNKTGQIIAVSAGRSDVDAQYIARFDEPKQPGSSIKPILDYAPNFDKLGWCTSRVITDKAIQIDGRTIVNADHNYYGDVTLERALAKSLNTPAIQALEANVNEYGKNDQVKYLKSIGIHDKVAEAFNIQYSMGGSTMEASTTQMAAAYAVLANGGYYIEPHMILKIEFKDGSKTIENNPKKTRVLSEQAAFMTSDLLYKAVNGRYKGENLMGSLGFGAYPVYGKTGTSSWDDADAEKYGGAMRDEWMINYTSEYTIASWTGFDTGIVGGNTSINDYLFMNVNGWINKHMLDTITTKNATKIAKPSGISEYGGGYIKTSALPNAAKNNPKTEVNVASKTNALKASIEKASGLKSNNYTPESYAKLLAALEKANSVLTNDNASINDIDNAKQSLDNAVNGLVKKEAEKPKVDTSALKALTTSAQVYADKTKYQEAQVNLLLDAINKGIQIADKEGVTQAEIDSAIQAITSAQSACRANPVVPTPPVTPTP